MKKSKKNILYAAIDLFAEHGIQNVSIEMIAEKSGFSRANIYYHFKDCKDDMIEDILKIYDNLIGKNTPCKNDCLMFNTDARSVLSKLFFTFRGVDSDMCRKINRIIFSGSIYIKRIDDYLFDKIFYNREEDLKKCFEMLINQGKVAPFETGIAASIINRLLITYAIEDARRYPFEEDELPPCLTKLQEECMFIVSQILNGNFHR